MPSLRHALLLLLLPSGSASAAVSDACSGSSLAELAQSDENMMLQLASRQQAEGGTAYLKEWTNLHLEDAGPPHIAIRPCDDLDGAAPALAEAEEQAMRRSMRGLCKQFPKLMEAHVHAGFEQNYAKWYDQNGWIDEAYVNYFSNRGDEANGKYGDGQWAEMVEMLIESVHLFSKRPVVVFNFGNSTPETWNAERFPQLVLFNISHNLMEGVSKNWDKVRSMMLARVRTGIQMDSDMFIYSHADKLFQRTRDEVTAEYPWPIMPGHWMSRDNDPEYINRTEYACYAFECPGCPSRTMRWGMAHPTWTFHALPFLGDLMNGAISQPKRVLSMSPEASHPVNEDEDFFNVGLWTVGAWKQWCKFETVYPDAWPKFLSSNIEGMNGCCKFHDPKWYPDGMPFAFYMSHGAKKPKETRIYLDYLKNLHVEKKWQLPEVYFNYSFYNNKDDMLQKLGLQQRHPGTNSSAPPHPRCLL